MTDLSPTQGAAVVADIVSVREDVRILRLHTETPLAYSAGQYINISFGGLAPRAYSIANAPGGAELEIHIKRGGGEASAYVMEKLKKDERVTFTGPEGGNIYRPGINGPILALAGGLGIAPVKAIAEYALTNGFAHPFTLMWGAADESEHYLDKFFTAMVGRWRNFVFTPVAGRPITEALKDYDARFSHHHIFVSGPPAMISALIPVLLDKGAQRAKISYDRHPEAATLKS